MDICEYFFRVEVEEEKDWMEVQVEEKDGGAGGRKRWRCRKMWNCSGKG